MSGRAAQPEETALYRIFGDEGLLLYIGISKDFGKRWKQHAKKQPWWSEKRQLTTEWYDSRPVAKAAETAAIRAERPKYNKQHALRPPKPRKVSARRTPAGWMTVTEAAAKAGCSRQCVYDAEKNGQVEVRRSPGKRHPLIHEDDLARWVATRQPRKVVPFGLSDRQAEFLLNMHRHRPDNNYSQFIRTSAVLRRRGLLVNGLWGQQLTAEGERVAGELLLLREDALAGAA